MSETLSAIVSTSRRSTRQPALYIGLAGDAPRTAPARLGLGGLDRVDIGRSDRRVLVRGADPAFATLTLVDERISGQHARLTRVANRWVVDDLQSKNGTWVAGEPITRRPLEDGDVIVVGHTAIVFREAGGELPDHDGSPDVRVPGLATFSSALDHQLARLETAASSRVPIEILGETGTGKEVVARGVHTLSGRTGAFIAVNCGGLPGTLLEAELFGHKRGAYTGATEDRAGLIRSADRGTLFLDEIAELPAPSQAAMLRVLQEGEVTPLGADRPAKVDVRIVTASHKDLDAEVAGERFRADLRARLLGVSIELPPLRDRLEDLGLLVATFLDRCDARRDIAFSSDAVLALYAHRWPLNVRELERTIAAAVGVAGERIELEHLPRGLRETAPAATRVAIGTLSAEDRELRDTLAAAVQRHAGNIAAVARELRKDPTQIRRWIKRLGIERK